MIRVHVVPVRNIKNVAADNYVVGRNSVPCLLYMLMHLFEKMECYFFAFLAGGRDRTFNFKFLRWRKNCADDCLAADSRRNRGSACNIFNYYKGDDSKAGGGL